MTDEIIISVDQHIANVTLNRPDARNALTFGMYQALTELCRQAGTAQDDQHIKAIVIAGAGEKAFAAGTDIGQFTSFKTLQDGHDADAFRAGVLKKFNKSLGNGLSKLAGKVFRIGHLGDFNDLMLLGTLSGVEMGLSLADIPHQKGGVDAAMSVLND